MGIVNGTIETTRTNDYGFTSYKISGKWWGCDAKGGPVGSEGDAVTFDGFERQDKKDPDKFWPTIKRATLKKISSATTPAVGSSGPGEPSPRRSAPPVSTGSRDSYWADKAADDKLREPRIVYQAAYERAIQFVDLAIRVGAFQALEKAKPTAKLEILESFVEEQTLKIMAGAFSATVPHPKSEIKPTTEVDTQAAIKELDEDPETWQ